MANHAQVDVEQIPHIAGGSVDVSSLLKDSNGHQEPHARETAGVWVYIFQIIFQVTSFLILLLQIFVHKMFIF